MTKDNETIDVIYGRTNSFGDRSYHESKSAHLPETPYIRKDLLTEGVDNDSLNLAIDAVREFNAYRDAMDMKQNHSQNILLKAAEHLLELIEMGE